ncbi:hypothetical protein V6667_02455 [Neisseria leonii]|uniref:Uncharacterized protein n=1 Tax=Neisseria leonii TaxID=2995413 RepID=A0A9X4ID30_9NEIS|nr:hypothetical protein [Neisseria sp. 51.81]MDD9327281.1 hypothetical protein [Neisseria sp. 51.81]
MFNMLLSSLKEDSFAYFIAAIVLVILFKAKAIRDFWVEWRSHHRQCLERAIQYSSEHKDIEIFLKNKLLENELSKITKINAELILIKKIIAFHRWTAGKYTFGYISRATKYMYIDHNKLVMKINILDWLFDSLINWLFFIALSILGICFIALPSVEQYNTAAQLIAIILMGTFCILLGVFFLTQTIPYRNAKKLESELNTFNAEFHDNNMMTLVTPPP